MLVVLLYTTFVFDAELEFRMTVVNWKHNFQRQLYNINVRTDFNKIFVRGYLKILGVAAIGQIQNESCFQSRIQGNGSNFAEVYSLRIKTNRTGCFTPTVMTRTSKNVRS